MPWDKVMSKWKKGTLTSGSKHGKPVKNQKQAVAIMLSEKQKASEGKKEYSVGPSDSLRKKKGLK
jgi:hypothetical protein